ncbi:hypothetical protein FRC11_011925, partial [Ceratobasidium sp. 423]
IKGPMKNQIDQATSRVLLHRLDERVVRADIRTYFKCLWRPMSITWNAEQANNMVAALANRAGNLFMFAATIAQYITEKPFTTDAGARRLANVLESSEALGDEYYREVDERYTLIVREALDDPSLDEVGKDNIRRVLHLVTSGYWQGAVTVNTISVLLGMNSMDQVWAVLRPLWSVLDVSEDSGAVAIIHSSFAEYISNPSRSKQYCCDSKVYAPMIPRSCFHIFRGMQPQFNICGLESSYVPDNEVAGLEERVHDVISSNLLYASENWAVHLKFVKASPELLEELEEFLSVRLLLWMEVMNLKGCAHKMPESIQLVKEWVGSGIECSEDLRELIHDAHKFTATFARNRVSNSTPHIYTSMLPLWPGSSPIGRCYSKRIQGMIRSEGTAVSQRYPGLLSIWHFENATKSPVYSPDGALIALGVGNEVLLLDASTGRLKLPPFKGHKNAVLSVQFWPSGAHILSIDGTIRLWSTESGKTQVAPGPLLGHITLVTSITCSPDGTYCATGPMGDTINIWNSREKKLISVSTENHGSIIETKFSTDGHWIFVCHWNCILLRDPVDGRILKTLRPKDINVIFSSADISHDSKFITACSRSGAIYIWDAETEQLVRGPGLTTTARGCTKFTSISFSPDGSWIISGSRDGTLHVWDVRSGDLMLGPLEEHTDTITSVRFSPDCAYFISSSEDKSLRLWDASSIPPKVTQNTPPGHAGPVTSVGFSPDGVRIVSGSEDQTVCGWDSENGKRILGPLKKDHNDRVLVAHSPDGSQILSNAPGGLVLLSAQTGSIILGPIQPHQPIQSAAFSSDGTRIVLASTKNIVQVLASDTGEIWMDICPPITPWSDWLTSIALSLDGSRIAIGSVRSSLSMYSTSSGQLIYGPLSGHTNGPRSLAFSPDSARIVSGSFSAVLVRETKSGEIVLGPLKGHTEWVNSVEYSPDGTQIISGARDSAICVWDARTGKPVLGPVKWHAAPVRSARYSPDGTRIVSGSDDRTIRVTDVKKDSQH